jgi:hypothetical protein
LDQGWIDLSRFPNLFDPSYNPVNIMVDNL